MEFLYRMRLLLVMAIIAITSLFMHFNHFTKDLVSIHVWRQTQTQTTINNFYEEDFNILNPRKNDRGSGTGIFRMEFPLMQWCIAGIYKLFGHDVIITRICMFFIGLLSVLGMYVLLNGVFVNPVLALMGAWAFNFSPSFYYYTLNPLPDNLALCTALWGLAFFFKWVRIGNRLLLLISGLLIAIGSLCKLPFVLFYSVPVVYFLREFLNRGVTKQLLTDCFVVMVFFVFPAAWYITVIPSWSGNGIVKGITDNTFSVEVLWDYLQHNLVSTLPELLINYGSVIFFLAGFFFLFKYKSFLSPLFLPLMALSISVLFYFFFELNMIAKVHDYYLFPFYPLIFMLVAYGAYNIFAQSKTAKAFTFCLLLILPVTAYLRMHKRWDTNSPGFNKDLLIHKDALRSAVPKSSLCLVGNDNSHFIFFYYIDKKGWIINDEELNNISIKNMIASGAEFLYSDSPLIEENDRIKPFIDSMLMQKGTIKVFRLKNKKAI